jgi:CO/xanthine dehydrogenase Mo-binding subunit
MSDFYRKWASYELLRKKRRENDKAHSGSSEMLRGIGITCGFQGSGLLYHGEDNGDYCLEAALLEDGTLEINSNMVSGENKLAALWQSIAAEILSLVHDKVRINYSSQAPDCGPSCSSRNITSVTQLLESCCIEIREKRSGAPLPITVRKSAKPQNGSLPLRGIPESEKIPDAAYFSRLAQIASVVEIEIDPQGFSPVIRGVWLAVDGGKIASQGDARQALYTGVAQALGWSFSEHINYSDGQLDIGQYENYSILGAGEIPSVKIEFLNDDSEERKGIGELPHTCVPAAYMQAISQALDYHFTGIPVKKDDFVNAEGIKEDA